MRVREGGSEKEGGKKRRERGEGGRGMEKEVGSESGTNLQSNKFLVLVLSDYLTGNAPFQENIHET